jgi:hypothetical protein
MYKLATIAAETSNAARRRTDPCGRFILQAPHFNAKWLQDSPAEQADDCHS